MTVEIRSYRAVFDLERRIYRLDRLRLNPAGVPVRGIVYFLALLAAALLAGRLPLLELLVGALPWYLVYVALPGVVAALLTLVKIEGRPFHLAAQGLARHRLGPRSLVGLCGRREGRWGGAAATQGTTSARWWPPEIVLLADGSDAHARQMRYSGPGVVRVAVAHELRERRCARLRALARVSQLTLEELDGARRPAHGRVIALARTARLKVR